MEGIDAIDARFRELMAKAQAGDAEAYAELLTALVPRIRRAVSRQVRLPDGHLDDVVQEVLLSLHQARATYQPGRPFLPWLAAIVRYRATDALRHHGRQGLREVVVEDLDVTFAAEPANTPQTEADEVNALVAAVQALPAGQRQAIELLKMQEMSLRDAAAVTGSSVGALKVATHRAMGALRRALGKGSAVQKDGRDED